MVVKPLIIHQKPSKNQTVKSPEAELLEQQLGNLGRGRPENEVWSDLDEK